MPREKIARNCGEIAGISGELRENWTLPEEMDIFPPEFQGLLTQVLNFFESNCLFWAPEPSLLKIAEICTIAEKKQTWI